MIEEIVKEDVPKEKNRPVESAIVRLASLSEKRKENFI